MPLQVSCDVTYNGHTLEDFIPERTSVYVEQEDKHMPELSVRETLDFAALCHGTGGRRGPVLPMQNAFPPIRAAVYGHTGTRACLCLKAIICDEGHALESAEKLPALHLPSARWLQLSWRS